jgi:hypothetical protein
MIAEETREPTGFISNLSEQAQKERSIELARRQELIQKMNRSLMDYSPEAEASMLNHRA